MSHERAFHYGNGGWKPNAMAFECDRWAEWCGWYPQHKRRLYETPVFDRVVSPQLLDGRIGYRLAENECKLLRSALRQLRAAIRRPQVGPTDAMAGSREAYELLRFNLRIAEWSREFLMGKASREVLQKRFDDRKVKHGYPMRWEYARRLLFLKIVQFAF